MIWGQVNLENVARLAVPPPHEAIQKLSIDV
jgi:hypothetical protein